MSANWRDFDFIASLIVNGIRKCVCVCVCVAEDAKFALVIVKNLLTDSVSAFAVPSLLTTEQISQPAEKSILNV